MRRFTTWVVMLALLLGAAQTSTSAVSHPPRATFAHDPHALAVPGQDAIAAPGEATLLRAPYIQNPQTTSLVIVWTSVEDGASEVHYGPHDTSLVAPATSTLFTTPATTPDPYKQYYVHEATLTGLAPDTVYQYKIFTNGADLTPGGVATARTAKPAAAAGFRFAGLGDSGDGSQNQKDVATRLQQVQPDLILHTGDMVYSEATYDGFEQKFFQIYKDLIKSVWFAPTVGNHDESFNGGKSVADVFVTPHNSSSDPVRRELYYSFDYGNAHFVVCTYQSFCMIDTHFYLPYNHGIPHSYAFCSF